MQTQQERFFGIAADIAEMVMIFLKSETFSILTRRINHLARGQFIPQAGLYDTYTWAGLLQMSPVGANHLFQRMKVEPNMPGDRNVFDAEIVNRAFKQALKFDRRGKKSDI